MKQDKLEADKRIELPDWNQIPSSDSQKKPRLKWENNDESHSVVFKCHEPLTINMPDGKFFVFDVEENGEQKVITSSAWTMLRGIRSLGEDLFDKRAMITVHKIKGKTLYEVVDLDVVKEESVA